MCQVLWKCTPIAIRLSNKLEDEALDPGFYKIKATLAICTSNKGCRLIVEAKILS
jgi:hypothetical protein